MQEGGPAHPAGGLVLYGEGRSPGHSAAFLYTFWGGTCWEWPGRRREGRTELWSCRDMTSTQPRGQRNTGRYGRVLDLASPTQ